MAATDVTKAIRAEQKLSKELRQHVGKWVAVKDHKVVAESESLSNLVASTEGQNLDGIRRVTAAQIEISIL